MHSLFFAYCSNYIGYLYIIFMEDRNRVGFAAPYSINLIIFQGGDFMVRKYIYFTSKMDENGNVCKEPNPILLDRDEYKHILGFYPEQTGASSILVPKDWR